MTPIQKAIEFLEWVVDELRNTQYTIKHTEAVEALAALRAVNETHVMVPREPSEEMIDIGCCHTDLDGYSTVVAVYTAMIEAAQKEG